MSRLDTIDAGSGISREDLELFDPIGVDFERGWVEGGLMTKGDSGSILRLLRLDFLVVL